MKKWAKRTGIAIGVGAAVLGATMLTKSPKKPMPSANRSAIERKVSQTNSARMKEAQIGGQKIKVLTLEEKFRAEEKRKADIASFMKTREPTVAKVVSTNSMTMLWDGFSRAFTKQGLKFGAEEFDRSMSALKDKLKNSPSVRKTWLENYPVGESGQTRYGKKLADLVSKTSVQNPEVYARVERVETILVESSKLPKNEKAAMLKTLGL
jgi:hypothetical protein